MADENKLFKTQIIEDVKRLATLKFDDLPNDGEWAKIDLELSEEM